MVVFCLETTCVAIVWLMRERPVTVAPIRWCLTLVYAGMICAAMEHLARSPPMRSAGTCKEVLGSGSNYIMSVVREERREREWGQGRKGGRERERERENKSMNDVLFTFPFFFPLVLSRDLAALISVLSVTLPSCAAMIPSVPWHKHANILTTHSLSHTHTHMHARTHTHTLELNFNFSLNSFSLEGMPPVQPLHPECQWVMIVSYVTMMKMSAWMG